VRVALSNVFGTAPLAIGAASVAMRGREAGLFPGTTWAITFGGSETVVIPAGGMRLSDPVDLEVFRLTDLAVDVYLPEGIAPSSPATMHGAALQTSYISTRGNHAGTERFPVTATTESWFVVARVDVETDAAVGAVVAFGDSITDGSRSTLDANARWPNHLARRLAERDAPMAVVNVGIGGNRVLSDAPDGRPMVGVSALKRFDRDVLEQPGVTHVIVLEGINDIGFAEAAPSPSADEIIAGHQELVRRARAAGLRVYGATLTPFEGARYFTDVGEAKRRKVNEWIRSTGAYDAVIDFDALTRDPVNPGRLRPEYDSGDGLHPSDAGYRAMGEAVDLMLFQASARVQ
jgi:lysophospholipase L1-like esterase